MDGTSRPGAALDAWLYVETVDDLAHRSQNGGSAYTALGIAPLIRKLLLDDNRLVDAANRDHRLKLLFEIAPVKLVPPTFHKENGLWMVPQLAFGQPLGEGRTACSRDSFLAATVAQYEQNPVSVREVVRYFAHVHGGVHRGAPTTPFEEFAMAHADQAVLSGDAWQGILVALGRIVSEALQPLTDIVRPTVLVPEEQLWLVSSAVAVADYTPPATV